MILVNARKSKGKKLLTSSMSKIWEQDNSRSLQTSIINLLKVDQYITRFKPFDS